MSLSEQVEDEVRDVLKTSTVEGAKKIVRGKHAGPAMLGLISFFEAVLPLPILTDPFLIAAILLDRARARSLVLLTVVSSVLGGVVAYLMALFLFDFLMSWLSPAMIDQFNMMVREQNASTFMLTAIGAVTPVPYTIVAWVVAVLQGSLLVFTLASVLGRGFRYGVVGYATYRFGPAAVSYIKKYLGVASLIVLVAAAAAYFFLK
ncbi:hypothetical protein KC902_03365 [Candidatus Kaiserbacteria bacterium]|nr:hypothetical protein [Candidatus Kaiserbacteria bacterium]